MAHIYPEVNSLEKHALIGDGNCVALVQKLTDVGHTSRWRPAERVMDAKNIAPGTVIATFEDGRYPNRHTGNHAALYLHSGPNSMKTGKPAYIVVMDQWIRKGRVSARSIYPKARSLSVGLIYDDSDNAEMFYDVK
jgi:hypothetical protein